MRLLLISSSTVHGYGYLDQPEPEIKRFMEKRKRVGFIPYALHDHAGYTGKVRERLQKMGLEVSQIDRSADLDSVDAVFVGGGNTFRLLKGLYQRDMIRALGERVRSGLPYLGSSAGSNVAAPTIKTTNDMPIVQPPSFDALGLIGFQLNPHYLDPDPKTTHMGETREERLQQYLEENEIPVLGLREGSTLRVEGEIITLLGQKSARLFRKGVEAIELPPGPIDPLG